MAAAVQCYMQALRSGSSKSQWNVCYGISGLLKVPAAAAALGTSQQLPELLLAVSAIASSSPNFKVMHLNTLLVTLMVGLQ